MQRINLFLLFFTFLSFDAYSHHGMGTFDPTIDLVLTGVVTEIAMVNPHAFIYLEAVRDDGSSVEPWRCEMRAATVLRRSGWTEELFLEGRALTIEGIPDREQPNTCYVATVNFADGTSIDRYQQLVKNDSSTSRPLILEDGTPNIFGYWAAEQRISTDPRGRIGDLVDLSEAQRRSAEGIPPSQGFLGASTRGMGMGMGMPPGLNPTEDMINSSIGYEAGSDNPRLNCKPTNIFFDWTFDSMVNYIYSERGKIILQYGSHDLYRVIHTDLDNHPANLELSAWGHSVGQWVDSNLVVDTVGFEPGYLRVPFMYSDQMHVVETFSLNDEANLLYRTWTATDPKHFTGTFEGSDVVAISNMPYQPYNCDDRSLSENDEEFLRRL
tara:strand:- start:3337 stop:4482 length:1146 start_codon:yes stop_codon:yes gene_type:complete